MDKKDISVVIEGLEKYLKHMTESNQFNIREFMNFMEPIFKNAGYREKNISDKTNILVILDGLGVGDFIWKTGVLRELRRIYPDANIRLVMNPAARVMIETCPYVDEIILFKFDLVNFVKIFKNNIEVAKKLLQKKTDICYAFTYYIHTPLLMYMSGAVERISYKFDDDDTINWPDSSASPHFRYLPLKRCHLNSLATVSVPQFLYGGHNVDISFALLDYILKSPVANRNMEVWLTALDKNVAENVLADKSKKYFALAMGGNTLNKHYPPENYAKLIQEIYREDKNSVFVILGGGKADLQSAEIIKNNLPEDIYRNNIIDLTNKTTYRQSAAILSLCEMYIGNDTGLMHVSAAVKVPALAIFCFPADLPDHRLNGTKMLYPYGVANIIVQPAKSLPECAAIKVHNHYGCKMPRSHCITQIKVETVFKGYRLLKDRAAKNIIETLYIK